MVIDVVDRLARSSPHGRPRLIGRLWTMQLRAINAVVHEPTDLLDDAYLLTGRLVELHREFAHRVLEALDNRHDPKPSTQQDERGSAPVVLLPR